MSQECATSIERCPTLHVFAFSTERSCGTLACWTRWAAAMITKGGAASPYTLHIRSHEVKDTSARNQTEARHYLRGVRSKVFWMEQVMKRPVFGNRDDVFVFTDLDVVPFAPYWNLAREALKHDIMFMPERHKHKGQHGFTEWVVNSGFCRSCGPRIWTPDRAVRPSSDDRSLGQGACCLIGRRAAHLLA